ncbi:MAG: MBL fold metallo-hydrolase [Clostridia bacterium]|nr:MBL fold metallo-hydrolase [Clostridia bacterium]MBQ4085488.1 MBL fold metallo-hydrolase [Clostridia bacterium]
MDGLKVTYLGQCCFLLEADGIRIVTDPYLSNYVDKNHEGWKREYEAPCALKELKPDLVLISHSHDDHMDPQTLGEYRKSGGNAAIAAPAPETGLLKDIGFSRIIDARAEREFHCKDAVITPIACAHTTLDMDENGRFRNLSYLIDFGECCVFFGGDMSLYDGLKERILLENCDLLLLPCNGRDEERTSQGIIGNTTAEEAAQLSAELGVPFIPAHHDLYVHNGRPTEEIVQAAKDAGAEIFVLKPEESISLGADDEDDDFE